MAYSVIDIAKKLIKMADDDIANGGDNITNLKLQKLLYYQQGYHLAAFDTPNIVKTNCTACHRGQSCLPWL